jgi:mannose-6-phosphate isomerase-like protein (cupin superfamily)
MSQTGVHRGGESRRVKPKDVIIVPAGTPHRFSELDGPIVYLVYRFEPKLDEKGAVLLFRVMPSTKKGYGPFFLGASN